MRKTTQPLPGATALLAQAHALPAARIGQFMVEGQRYWVKRPEILPWRLRLQKGNAQRVFHRETTRLKEFAALGAPVARIVAEDETLIVLQDMGEALSGRLHRLAPAAQHDLICQVARALAALHDMGLSHGRPRLRDICWDEERISFLDLEAGARQRAARWRQALDLIILLHSLFQSYHDLASLAPVARDAYGAADNRQVLPLAQRLARHARILQPLLWPFLHRDRKRGKKNSEIIAAVETLDLLS